MENVSRENKLPDKIKSNPSIGSLKRYLSKDDKVVPIYYTFGKRVDQIRHTRLRLGMSDLNFDLFRRHLRDDPGCECGYIAETSTHYFLHCPLFLQSRTATINQLETHHHCINILLYGSHDLTLQENKKIVLTVQNFINISGRFGNA